MTWRATNCTRTHGNSKHECMHSSIHVCHSTAMSCKELGITRTCSCHVHMLVALMRALYPLRSQLPEP